MFVEHRKTISNRTISARRNINGGKNILAVIQEDQVRLSLLGGWVRYALGKVGQEESGALVPRIAVRAHSAEGAVLADLITGHRAPGRGQGQGDGGQDERSFGLVNLGLLGRQGRGGNGGRRHEGQGEIGNGTGRSGQDSWLDRREVGME